MTWIFYSFWKLFHSFKYGLGRRPTCLQRVCSAVEWGSGQESSHCFGSSSYSTVLAYLFDCCFFFKFHFIFNSVYACVSVRVSVHVSAGACRGQRPQIHHLVAVLGIELGTSARTMCALHPLHRWAISAAPTVLPVTFERWWWSLWLYVQPVYALWLRKLWD